MKGIRLGVMLVLLIAATTAFSCSDCSVNGHNYQVLGEMTVDPEQVSADGQANAEIAILIFEIKEEERIPLPGVVVEVASSRNQGGNVLDSIEQPTGPTDADGRAVAYVRSSTLGEAQLAVLQNGAPICESFVEQTCVPLRVMITFIE